MKSFIENFNGLDYQYFSTSCNRISRSTGSSFLRKQLSVGKKLGAKSDCGCPDPPFNVKSRCFESHCFEINPSSIDFLSANRKGEEPEGDGAATDNARKHAESEAGHG